MSDDPLGILPQIEELEAELVALDTAVAVIDRERTRIEHELSEARFIRMKQANQDKAADRAARSSA